MKNTLDFIRGAVRPLVTLAGVGVILVMELTGKPISKEMWILVTGFAAFWFGGRGPKQGGQS